MNKNPSIIVMGVSGCGKTTIGQLLAKKLKIPFYDADDFHPKKNISKMKEGIPLNDLDRMPWLQNLAIKLKEWEKEGAVLACSALKESYREILKSETKNLKWVYLRGTYEAINSRLTNRKGHYFNNSLLKSQFEVLEIPKYGVSVNISENPETIIEEIIEKLAL